MRSRTHRGAAKKIRHFLYLMFAMALAGCGPSNPAETTDNPAKKSSTQMPAAANCQKRPAPSPVRTLSYITREDKQVYLRGFNIAWFQFAQDFDGDLDEKQLRKVLRDTQDAGANSLRWWLHVDGSSTPQWGMVHNQRLVTGPGGNTIENFRRALDIAAEYKVYIVPSLWSFDMLRDNAFRRPPNRDNYRLLTEDVVLKSYLNNALIPLVQALNNHPQLFAWELFNEPEIMAESWFPSSKDFYGGPTPSLNQLQRVLGLMAAAIHETAHAMGQTALVTTGSKSLGKYNSDVAGGKNLYRDDRLINAADGNCAATLDFYAPHYYNNEGRQGKWSPFHHPASHWGLDKPIVIGEFHVDRPLDALNNRIEATQLCRRLVGNGYAGGWSWQWNKYREAAIACEKAIPANNIIPTGNVVPTGNISPTGKVIPKSKATLNKTQ